MVCCFFPKPTFCFHIKQRSHFILFEHEKPILFSFFFCNKIFRWNCSQIIVWHFFYIVCNYNFKAFISLFFVDKDFSLLWALKYHSILNELNCRLITIFVVFIFSFFFFLSHFLQELEMKCSCKDNNQYTHYIYNSR